MYRDATDLAPDSIVTGFDICIAGAGAAGIAMAQRLIGSSKKVLLLANGLPSDKGDKPEGPLQQIYIGTTGPFLTKVDSEFLTRSRLNMYGGTTNHFEYNARPLDKADLLPRPGYRDASWPLTMETLNAYYPATNTLGEFGPFNYDDLDFWAKELHGPPFPADDSMRSAIFHQRADQATTRSRHGLGTSYLPLRTLSCYSMRKYCTWPPRRISAS